MRQSPEADVISLSITPAVGIKLFFHREWPAMNMCPYNIKEKSLHKNHKWKFSSDNICMRNTPPDPSPGSGSANNSF